VTDITYYVTQNKDLFALSADELPQALPATAYPLHLHTIQTNQQQDAAFQALSKPAPAYQFKSFSRGDKTYQIWCLHDKIIVLQNLLDRVTQWYHDYLCHPGETRTEKTIAQYFIWTKLRSTVKNICQRYQTCIKTKKSTKKYGHLPGKKAEANPWENSMWI